ncbi:MAG: 8-oxo-dGTP diphosphatase [Pseudomonadaceae bacterium]|nr:8-oxo-dGTP diphosphatase [Pseudomonadaceae bacterium]
MTNSAPLTFDSDRWQPDAEGTLLFLRRGGEVLLIHKKRGHGAGKINGPGGKLEATETPAQCVQRETLEEVGLRVPAPRLAARLRFLDDADDDWLGWVYVADAADGDLCETEEAIPYFAARDELPLASMWPDDRVWLPWVLRGYALTGTFWFHRGDLLAHHMTLVGFAGEVALGPVHAEDAWL